MPKAVNYIKPIEIPQGSLVFIFHHKKPMKTGWWRKIRRTAASKETDCIYILEKSFEKNFSKNADQIKNSRVEHGIICMNENTVKLNDIEEYNGDHSYEILACASGIASGIITSNNYLIKQTLNNTTNTANTAYAAYKTLMNLHEKYREYGIFLISSNGKKFFDLYFKSTPKIIDEIELFIQNHTLL